MKPALEAQEPLRPGEERAPPTARPGGLAPQVNLLAEVLDAACLQQLHADGPAGGRHALPRALQQRKAPHHRRAGAAPLVRLWPRAHFGCRDCWRRNPQPDVQHHVLLLDDALRETGVCLRRGQQLVRPHASPRGRHPPAKRQHSRAGCSATRPALRCGRSSSLAAWSAATALLARRSCPCCSPGWSCRHCLPA